MQVLHKQFRDWKQLRIYEPGGAGPLTEKLAAEAEGYVGSVFIPGVVSGSRVDGRLAQNLESLTFADDSFDLVITQDVFEHVLHPELAFREVGRVLRSGGAHVFTVPWLPDRQTITRAIETAQGETEHLQPAEYHGDPMTSDGALVVTDWGESLFDLIRRWTEMDTVPIYPDEYVESDFPAGIDSHRLLAVFVSTKP
jgi:SAM-dependent methyltransferase